MSIKERQYQRASYNQMLKCIRWAQNALNLRDWTITLLCTDTLDDLAEITIDQNKMYATVEINCPMHKKENENIYSTLIHEMIHILSIGVCKIDNDKSEPISYCFEDLLYVKYCLDNKLKLMPEKEN